MAKKITLKSVGQKTQGVFNLIPKEARVSLAIIGGGYLAYAIYKKLNPSEEDKAQNQLDKEAKELGKGTLQESEYKSLANSLYDAFMTAFGTDEDAIYGVFNKLGNDADIRRLIAAFGYRRAEWGFTDYDLPYFIKDELDATEIRYVNQILSAKNIKYRF